MYVTSVTESVEESHFLELVLKFWDRAGCAELHDYLQCFTFVRHSENNGLETEKFATGITR